MLDGGRDFPGGRGSSVTRRSFVRRAAVTGLSLSAAPTLLAACQDEEGSGPEPTRGGTLTIGGAVPAADVDPVTLYSIGAITTVQLAGEYLTFPKPDYSLEPKLATEWAPSKGGQAWSFSLRRGVQWQDGSPLTADDVVATFDRLTDPDGQSAALSAFAGILSMGNTVKMDRHTVEFRLDRPYADFPYLVSAFNYNAIILPADYEIGQFTRGGVGTGPFVLRDYTTKRGATYERNERYWDRELPHLDSVELRYYEDSAPMLLALQAGDVDLLPQLSIADAAPLRGNSDIEILQNPASQYRALHMRTDREPFSDKRVRQAVALSLNRADLVDVLLRGSGQPGHDHLFAPVFESTPGDAPEREQDHDRARALLAEAGFQNGLEVTLTGERTFECGQYATAIKEQCSPAGIDVTLDIQDQASYYGSGDNQPWLEVPFGLTAWISRGNPSQLIAPTYNCGAIWNSAHWCSDEFDRLLNEFDATLAPGPRQDVAGRLARMAQDEVPVVVAYFPQELRAARSTVSGLAAGPSSHLDAARVANSA